MSTLTYTQDAVAASKTRKARSETSIWRRLFDGFVAAQQRRAEREVALYLSRHGGLFTDGMERGIMGRLSGGTKRSV